MTRDELKAILASAPNKLGLQALEVIRAGTSLQALKDLIGQGASLTVYERYPRHPRTKFLTNHLITATYETDDSPNLPKESVLPEGGKIITHTIDFNHGPRGYNDKVQVRLEMFEYLLLLGAKGDDNGLRGPFLKSILNAAFWPDTNRAKAAFARVLAKAKPELLVHYTKVDYPWFDSLDSYHLFVDIGGDPCTAGALAHVLNYSFCSGRYGELNFRKNWAIAMVMFSAGAKMTMEEFEAVQRKWTDRVKRHPETKAIEVLEILRPAQLALVG